MLQAGRRLSRLASLAGNTRLGVISGVRGMADHATTEDIENKLKEKLAASHLEVIDTSGGCGASFNVMVVSPQFEGKNLLARHRMINIALQKEMETIHALSIRKVQSQKEYDADNAWRTEPVPKQE